MRGDPLRDHRTGERRRLLSLHALPASHRHRRLGSSANRRAHAASAPRRGPAQMLAPPGRRTREVLLRRVRLTPVQPQPPKPHLRQRAHGRLRRGPRRETLMALIRHLRRTLGANPRRRPRTTTRGQASDPARLRSCTGESWARANPTPVEQRPTPVRPLKHSSKNRPHAKP